MNDAAYDKTCDTLGSRILALIPDHPEILTMRDAFRLFELPSFKCDDLRPSYAQATGSLYWAQQRYVRLARLGADTLEIIATGQTQAVKIAKLWDAARAAGLLEGTVKP